MLSEDGQKEGYFLGIVTKSEDSADTLIISDEFFIKNWFDKSPKKGFDLLFKKYYTNLCNHAIRYVYSKEIAEDIVAEVFTNFWKNKIYETINSSYRAYLYTAVRNRAYTCIKVELYRNTTLDSTTKEFHNYDTLRVLQPDEILHYHELTQKLEASIQRLPNQSRKAFQLNRLEGKKYAEVALEMKITVSAVERLLSRALIKLKEDLKSEWIFIRLIIVSFVSEI